MTWNEAPVKPEFVRQSGGQELPPRGIVKTPHPTGRRSGGAEPVCAFPSPPGEPAPDLALSRSRRLPWSLGVGLPVLVAAAPAAVAMGVVGGLERLELRLLLGS